MDDLVTLVRQASPSLGVRAWHVRRPEGHSDRSVHSSIEIAWTEEGAPEYVVASRRITLRPSSVMIVPARAEHRTTVTPGTRAKVLGLSHAVVEEVADAMGVSPELEAGVMTNPRLLRLCEHIFD